MEWILTLRIRLHTECPYWKIMALQSDISKVHVKNPKVRGEINIHWMKLRIPIHWLRLDHKLVWPNPNKLMSNQYMNLILQWGTPISSSFLEWSLCHQFPCIQVGAFIYELGTVVPHCKMQTYLTTYMYLELINRLFQFFLWYLSCSLVLIFWGILKLSYT